ncbi:MAG: EI24 domain-containing protein [Pseudomonadota bacterium]
MIHSTMRPVLTAYTRALRSQLTPRMLLLSAIPFVLSLLLWGGLLYWGFEPFNDYLRSLFADHGRYQASGSVLATFGMGALKTLVVPLLAMLLLLPLMIFSSLLFMGVVAMPVIVKHVAARQFPTLEMKRGGSFAGSVKVNLTGFLLFVPLWLMTLPLYVFPPLALLAQVVLWGWLTARVMSYDALADHASEEERAIIMRTQRRHLTLIGILSGAAGALPGIVWVGGTLLSVVLFPFLAVISVWIYLLIFIFTGLWFQYFCLQALADLRSAQADAVAVAVN